jgi:RNA polymerase sigma factor (sigma-70 family)
LVYQTIAHTLRTKRVHFNTFDLEDLHNTVFLRFFDDDCKRLRQYEGRNDCSAATWIKVVTVHLVLDHLRKKGVDNLTAQKKQIPVGEFLQIADRQANPLKQLEEEEQMRFLEKAVAYLPPRERLFITLHYDQDVPIREVAEIMGLSESHAYTLKHRVIQKIQLHAASMLKNSEAL